MATVKEIAFLSGVSIGTVDRVLHNRGRVNEQTRQRVINAARQLDYLPNRAAQRLAARKKKLNFAFVQMDPQIHPFYEDINLAAYKKAEELLEYGVSVYFYTCQIHFDENGSTQYSVILPVGDIPAYFDGIAVPGAFPLTLLGSRVTETTLKVCYNVDSGARDILAYVGCDYEKAGELAAGLCAMSADADGEIAVFTEQPKALAGQIPSYTQRMKGFCRILAEKYPQCSIAGELFFGFNKEENLEAVESFLQKHPRISVIYLVNPGAYHICQTVRRVDPNGKIRIITNDLVPIQRKMLADGLISAVITQEPERQGSQPLQLMFDYLIHGKTVESRNCLTELSIRVADTIADDEPVTIPWQI